ncbi:MAG: LacI family DNA-binding transcriptional regulator [Candidatus Omnitrophota bacterium]|nr:LacI family transcriptional regulator [Candidatus Omnitrophota bacterium]MBU2528973.1 LacI family transcriptional regulator [bacterium]MBU3930184.1 LacI family transcriptional regulator [bacterium]MBU4122548.1 LacI family transcriptional regulator [bacterium]
MYESQNLRKIDNTSIRNHHVTIKDIAGLVGVSTATVSLALSGNSRISEETCRKVVMTAKKFGYRPSSAARSLAMNKSGNIALMIPNLDKIFQQSFFALAMNGVYDACLDNSYSLRLEVVSDSFISSRRFIRLFQERSVDGMLYVGSTYSDTYLNQLHELKFPFIFAGSYLNGGSLSFVTGDNKRGGKLAVEHLLDSGRRKIAHIYGDFNIASSLDRFNGYKDALAKAGIVFDDSLTARGGFSEDGGAMAMKKLLKQKPDSVFAGNDIMASGAVKEIKRSGLRVPEDISVCGMDDLPLASVMSPALTTIKYDIYGIARRAAEKLIDIIEGRQPEQVKEFLPVELIKRNSS